MLPEDLTWRKPLPAHLDDPVLDTIVRAVAAYRRYREDQEHLVPLDAKYIFNHGDVSAWSDPVRVLLTKEELAYQVHISCQGTPTHPVG